MLSKTLVVVAFVAFLNLASCTKVPRNEEDFAWFLDQVVKPSTDEEHLERTRDYVYIPHGGAVSEKDRHGAKYVKCVNTFGVDPRQGSHNKRCPQFSAKFEPVCAVTFDLKRNETQQMCFDNPIEFPEACNDDCEMKIKAYSYQGRNLYKGVGFCCCRTPMCNENVQKIVADAIATADKNLEARLSNQFERDEGKPSVGKDLQWP